MVRSFYTAVIGLASAGLLLVSSPAWACSANCGCHHEHQADKKSDQKSEPAQQDLLAPVDQVLSATCNCSGPSDCTCKKGECKCKKCSHPQSSGGTRKTELLKPLNTAPAGTALPADAKMDASAGLFI